MGGPEGREEAADGGVPKDPEGGPDAEKCVGGPEGSEVAADGGVPKRSRGWARR